MIDQGIQHIDDITIPVIEITAGWAASSVKNREDCDDAFAYLMSACAQIEFAIDTELTKPKGHQDMNWMARANCALKYKKAALQIVNQRRSQIGIAARYAAMNGRDQRLLAHIRASVPNDTFVQWVREVNFNEPALEEAA